MSFCCYGSYDRHGSLYGRESGSGGGSLVVAGVGGVLESLRESSFECFLLLICFL